MTDTEIPDKPDFGTALSRSINSDGLGLITTSADIALDKAISSGTFDGIPVVGLLAGGVKAIKGIREHLYLKKIINFLQELGGATKSDRAAFVKKLENSGELEKFGETILLVLDRTDDSSKPAIVGRILAAHISGKFGPLSQAMRLVAIVNRVYVQDLTYLQTFRSGVPKEVDIAESLFSAGLLTNTGFDGGGADQNINPGGTTYVLNEFGRLLNSYGLRWICRQISFIQ